MDLQRFQIPTFHISGSVMYLGLCHMSQFDASSEKVTFENEFINYLSVNLS